LCFGGSRQNETLCHNCSSQTCSLGPAEVGKLQTSKRFGFVGSEKSSSVWATIRLGSTVHAHVWDPRTIVTPPGVGLPNCSAETRRHVFGVHRNRSNRALGGLNALDDSASRDVYLWDETFSHAARVEQIPKCDRFTFNAGRSCATAGARRRRTRTCLWLQVPMEALGRSLSSGRARYSKKCASLPIVPKMPSSWTVVATASTAHSHGPNPHQVSAARSTCETQ
jgi:hypothetical protein